MYITGKTLYDRVHGILVQTIANRAGKDVKELLNWVQAINKKVLVTIWIARC